MSKALKASKAAKSKNTAAKTTTIKQVKPNTYAHLVIQTEPQQGGVDVLTDRAYRHH